MDYGTVTHNGRTITLTEQATLTNRVFTGWWGEAQEGKSYTVEYSARGKDTEGNEYRVYWQFDAVKGDEPEDESNYPWKDSDISRVVDE